jgi:hypothetical protein
MNKPILFILLSLVGFQLMAQSSTVCSGGEGSGPGGTVSFSVGQLVVESTIDSEGSISPGVQQSYESSSVYVNEPLFDNTLVLYPNPTTQFIQLDFGKIFTGQVMVFDAAGNVIFNQNVNTMKSRIDASGWSSGLYMVHVVKGNESAAIHSVLKQ